MNSKLAHMLVSLYPRPWKARYGAEFETLLQADDGGLKTVANVLGSALQEHLVPTPGLALNQPISLLEAWTVGAPWAVFGVAPPLLLAGAYFVACFILWSGWRIFLPQNNTPFVPTYGLSIVYFGVGRWLYWTAPILVGWAMGLVAVRQRVRAWWPAAGSVVVALMGAAARVRASVTDVPRGWGHIRLSFDVGNSLAAVSDGLIHAAVIVGLIWLPFFILRRMRSRSLLS